jgi:hypothetical protein
MLLLPSSYLKKKSLNFQKALSAAAGGMPKSATFFL